MKICLVHSEPEKLPRVQLELRSLGKAGHDAYILSPGIRARFKPRLLSAGLRYASLMVQELLECPDVYHVLNIPDVLALAPILKHGKLVYDVRSPWADELEAFQGPGITADFARSIERYVTRHADVVLAANRTLERRAREWGAKRVYIVPNYPPADFRPTIDPDEFKRQQDLSERKIILFVGKLSAVECTLDLLKVLLDMLKENSNVALVLVGDGPERSDIEQFVRAAGIENQVRITGWVPHSEVPNWIAMADVCMLPRREDMPSAKFYSPHSVRKAGEYLALGKPVIATPVGEFVGTDLPIRTVPLDDFPKAISEAFRNPPAVSRPADFTWEASERVLLEAYEELAKIPA